MFDIYDMLINFMVKNGIFHTFMSLLAEKKINKIVEIVTISKTFIDKIK